MESRYRFFNGYHITVYIVVALAAAFGVNALSPRGIALFGNWDTAAGVITGLPSPVAEVVPDLLLKSLGLLTISLIFATIVGVTLGILAAGRRRSGWSLAILVSSIIGVSIPSFFAALLLQILLIQWTRRTGSPLLPQAIGFMQT